MNQEKESKNQLKSENYNLVEFPEIIEVTRIQRNQEVTSKQTFTINKKRLSGVTFDNPVKVFNQILTLWQKNNQQKEPLMN